MATERGRLETVAGTLANIFERHAPLLPDPPQLPTGRCGDIDPDHPHPGRGTSPIEHARKPHASPGRNTASKKDCVPRRPPSVMRSPMASVAPPLITGPTSGIAKNSLS